MTVLLGYCGYRCDQCPAHKGNLRTHADRVKVSEDYHKYYGYQIEPENVACDGCLHAREAPNPDCPVRSYAIDRGYQTCAQCGDVGCAKLRKMMMQASRSPPSTRRACQRKIMIGTFAPL